MSETTTDFSGESSPRSLPGGHARWWAAGAAVVVLGVALGAYGSGLGGSLWSDDPEPTPPVVADSPETQPLDDGSNPVDDGMGPATSTPETAWRTAVLGRWKTFYKGDRYMTVRADGTATIEANLVEYSWFEKKVVGADRVVFEIVWTIENGALTFDTVGGEPAASVNVITSIHGKSKTYPIVHVTDDEFRYQSDDPEEPDYVWERLPAE